MRYPARGRTAERTTICISSQAGCAVNCPFCATGQAGFGRQLTPGEIVDQVLHWHRPPWQALGEDGIGHYNIVFMGMGEPLNNADRVFEAVRLLNDPARLGIGARHITVSTSGVVPGMDRMIDELPQVNLAISLHAATDALRDELVPINRKWPIREVIGAGRRFAARTGRRVSLEYVMIDGLNDTDEQAAGLAELARGWRSHVNLIPLNPTPGSRWSGTRGGGDLALRGDRSRRHHRDRARHPRPGDRGGLRPAPRSALGPVPERGSSGGRHPHDGCAADQREHPQRRLRAARAGGRARHRRRRRLDPPRRHGRPLRRQPDVRPGRRRGRPAAQRAAVPQPPDDQPAAGLRRALRAGRQRPHRLPRRGR